MEHLHIFSSDENQKFSLSYFKFIKEHFKLDEHAFLVFKVKGDNLNLTPKDFKVIYNDFKGAIKMMREIRRAKCIYFHGLNLSTYSFLLLSLHSKYLKKCKWIIWGGDLYAYKLRTHNLKSNMREKFRERVIRNMGGIITQLYGDYELAKEWYKTKGKYYYSFVYPSNLYKEYNLQQDGMNKSETIIQVGNSACETNNHIQIFEKLEKYRKDNIKIICPLSYSGKEGYINQVIEAGYEIFGIEKFVPITEFLSYENYLELLSKVDVAIFNHKRQRGLGNITTLLGLGKKVYIREEITTWQFSVDHDLKVYSANGDFQDLFEEMDEDIKRKNIQNMKTKFSKEKLVEDWKKIFNEGGCE